MLCLTASDRPGHCSIKRCKRGSLVEDAPLSASSTVGVVLKLLLILEVTSLGSSPSPAIRKPPGSFLCEPVRFSFWVCTTVWPVVACLGLSWPVAAGRSMGVMYRVLSWILSGFLRQPRTPGIYRLVRGMPSQLSALLSVFEARRCLLDRLQAPHCAQSRWRNVPWY